MITILLVGEQPIPNLLSILDALPQVAVLVHTSRTEGVAKRIQNLLPTGCSSCLCLVDPYNIQSVKTELEGLIQRNGWQAHAMSFNLTGGTKPMSLAAYQIAAERQVEFCYLQSEGLRTRLYRYNFAASGRVDLVEDRVLPTLISIDQYLRAFVDHYQVTGPKEPFEKAIASVLVPPMVDEAIGGVILRGALEVDMVVRCGNQVGIIEAKTGGKARSKGGIDQLNTAAGQPYLGTYTQKMLVIDQQWNTATNLNDLAQARHVKVIELPGFAKTRLLSSSDMEYLGAQVRMCLGQ